MLKLEYPHFKWNIYSERSKLLDIWVLMSIGCFQTSTMDAAKVLLEHFLVWKIVGTWAAAIEPYSEVKEPLEGMDCWNETVDRLLVGKTSPTALCQAIIGLGGSASFHPLQIVMVRVQVQRMSGP